MLRGAPVIDAGIDLSLPGGRWLREGWGDPLSPEDYPGTWEFDYQTSGFGGAGYSGYTTTIEDRADGKCRPLYDNETDLGRLRSIARRMAVFCSTYIGAQQALKIYEIGSGMTVDVSPSQLRDGEPRTIPPSAVEQIRRIVEDFLEWNDIPGEMDCEMHSRSREDGESFMVLERDMIRRGKILASVIEPDQVREPANPGQLIDWVEDSFGIECGSFANSWSFGVHTPSRRTDYPLGYHVVYDGAGRDWDYIPESRMLHMKRNVPRNAKRGVSDYQPIFQDLVSECKLARNVTTTAALQAAIAWVEQFPKGTSQAQAQGLGTNDLTRRIPTNVGNGGGTRSQKSTFYGAGSILKISEGREYRTVMGSERNDGFTVAAQMALRHIGIRWNFPEYMISGDASNANFASTLVAESPFVKAREAGQGFESRRWQRLLWKVVFYARSLGMLPDIESIPADELRRQIVIDVKFPKVASRDPLQLSQQIQAELQMGTVSLATAAADMGRDYEQEVSKGAKPAAVVAGPAGGNGFAPPQPGLSLPIAAAESFIESIREASKESWKGYP